MISVSCLSLLATLHSFLLSTAFAASEIPQSNGKVPFLRDIPSTGQEWVSLEGGVEFQPGSDNPWMIQAAAAQVGPKSKHTQRNLGRNGATYNPYANQVFPDSSNSEYDAYAQAWRLLGFYIDCSGAGQRRNLQGEGDHHDNNACQRYLLWAFVSVFHEQTERKRYLYLLV